MSSQVFNIAKGRFIELHDRVANNDPAAGVLVVVVLKAAEVDSALVDRTSLGAILGAAGNTEADFTNYSRKVLTDADIPPSSVDYTGNFATATIPDQDWTPAGGAVDNTTAKLLICYDPDSGGGTDADILPLVALDWVESANGSPIIASMSSDGYGRAT